VQVWLVIWLGGNVCEWTITLNWAVGISVGTQAVSRSDTRINEW